MPSLGNPLYKAVVKTASGQEYDLYKSKVIQDLTMSDDPDSLAKEVSLTVMNAAKNGVTLATVDSTIRPIIHICECWPWRF